MIVDMMAWLEILVKEMFSCPSILMKKSSQNPFFVYEEVTLESRWAVN